MQKKSFKRMCWVMDKNLISFVFCFFVVFLFNLTSFSRLFHSYRDEPIRRWGETVVPRENHLTHPQAELGLSHVASAGLEPTPDTAVTGEMIE